MVSAHANLLKIQSRAPYLCLMHRKEQRHTIFDTMKTTTALERETSKCPKYLQIYFG